MTAIQPPVPRHIMEMRASFDVIGIEDRLLLDPEAVQRRLDTLEMNAGLFIDGMMRSFLQPYGKRRHMQPGIERTQFILSKLAERPVYYVKVKSEE